MSTNLEVAAQRQFWLPHRLHSVSAISRPQRPLEGLRIRWLRSTIAEPRGS